MTSWHHSVSVKKRRMLRNSQKQVWKPLHRQKKCNFRRKCNFQRSSLKQKRTSWKLHHWPALSRQTLRIWPHVPILTIRHAKIYAKNCKMRVGNCGRLGHSFLKSPSTIPRAPFKKCTTVPHVLICLNLWHNFWHVELLRWAPMIWCTERSVDKRSHRRRIEKPEIIWKATARCKVNPSKSDGSS